MKLRCENLEFKSLQGCSQCSDLADDWLTLKAENERFQAERDIARDALAGIDIIEKGTRDDCAEFVREQVRSALDNVEWLAEYTEQYQSHIVTMMTMAAENERFRAIVDPLNELRAEEGDSIFVPCDNPDYYDGVGSYVEVTSEWTQWKPRKFGGDNLTEALKAAVDAKRAAEAAGKEND